MSKSTFVTLITAICIACGLDVWCQISNTPSQKLHALATEVEQQEAKMKAMVPPPLPVAIPPTLQITQMDTHLYGVNVPDGMQLKISRLSRVTLDEIAAMKSTNGTATIIWLAPK